MSNKFLDRLDDDTRERVLKSPFREFVTEYPEEEIRAIETEMSDAASQFSKSELEALGAIIRLTVEFLYYLKRTDMDSPDPHGVEWVNESTVSSLEFFIAVCQIYRITQGHVGSKLSRSVTSLTALRDEFVTRYQAFVDERSFEKKCGILLDLYKLQIVFAGFTYDWE